MDRLHVRPAHRAAAPFAVRAAERRGVSFGLAVSFAPAFSFGNRLWWYDVHQVEGAV
jgi:hypothetical protein